METAIICTALLGLLLFGLGLGVSLTRGSTNTVSGYNTDPTDRLYKIIRAHGNTTEYAPMLAVLMLFVGARNPATWIIWTMWLVTLCRLLALSLPPRSPNHTLYDLLARWGRTLAGWRCALRRICRCSRW
jgi:uncharacterized membrane protein YecN with MAPEG domain